MSKHQTINQDHIHNQYATSRVSSTLVVDKKI